MKLRMVICPLLVIQAFYRIEEDMSEDNNKVVTFEYDNGDTYLGEVNENGEPHGLSLIHI